MAEAFEYTEGGYVFYVSGNQVYLVQEPVEEIALIAFDLDSYSIDYGFKSYDAQFGASMSQYEVDHRFLGYDVFFDSKILTYKIDFNFYNNIMNIVSEDSTAYVEVTFKDTDGALVAPDHFDYTITDLVSEEVVRSTTTINSPGSVYKLKLTAGDNTILEENLPQEIRVIKLTAVYNNGDQITTNFAYVVTNLDHEGN